MNGWQIFIIVWLTLRVGIAMAMSGKPTKPDIYKARYTFINVAITVFALYKGGFWA